MRTIVATLGLATLLTAPALAQVQSPRQQQALPEAWMSIDSLATVLSLTAEQRAAVAPRLAELNAAMKQASDERQQMRSQMQSGAQPSGQEAFAAMRERMQGLQSQMDEKLAVIRTQLSPAQQATFDGLAKPQLMRRRPGG